MTLALKVSCFFGLSWPEFCRKEPPSLAIIRLYEEHKDGSDWLWVITKLSKSEILDSVFGTIPESQCSRFGGRPKLILVAGLQPSCFFVV